MKTGLTGMTSTALVEKGRTIVTMMTGNPAFSTPAPTLSDVTQACDELDKANQQFEANHGRLDREKRDQEFEVLKSLLIQLGGYVQQASEGDRDKILSSGFDVRREASPIGLLPAPQNVRAVTTAYPGRLVVRWSGVKGRSNYQLWQTLDPKDPASWTLVTITSKNRHVIEDLTSDQVYYYRVTALGTAGSSPVSDSASAKAA